MILKQRFIFKINVQQIRIYLFLIQQYCNKNFIEKDN
jgi:hypothetical protein